METIKFNKSDHTYKKEGKLVPSVTTVLPEIPEHLKYKQSFIDKTFLGTRVHKHCENLNLDFMFGKKLFKYEDVQESDVPYIHAYISFMTEELKYVYASELKVYHPFYNYAGTLDLIAKTKSFGTSISDIKCVYSISPATKLQTAAYLKAYNYRRKNKVWKRLAIQLKKDGTYKLYRFPISKLKTDFDIFICKLKSYQWDVENKIK